MPAPVTIVLPCFNEGTRVVESLATLASWFGASAEVLVIDDGSRDDTAAHAERFAREHAQVRVHRLDRNRGKGGAIRAAIPLIRTELVVFTDADLAFDRASVERVIAALADCEMAAGNRRHHRSYYTVPVRLFGFLYRRHIVGLLFNAFVRTLVAIPHRDTQCGLKGFRTATLAAIAPSLSTDGFALDVEMLMVARALDARLVDVPVNVHYETARSSVALLVSARAMAGDVLRIAWRRARGAYGPTVVRARATDAAADRGRP
jgi:glycosyltransferase involved in cell wall biosynthesis